MGEEAEDGKVECEVADWVPDPSYDYLDGTVAALAVVTLKGMKTHVAMAGKYAAKKQPARTASSFVKGFEMV
jgi:hypothetical protein